MKKEGDVNMRPNVVFILVDNVGWGNFGVYGGTIPTPRQCGSVEEDVAILEAAIRDV